MTLQLYCCTGLTSLPDRSGLENLKVESLLPEKMKPWKRSRRKAFALG